jgi:hypothetical protein
MEISGKLVERSVTCGSPLEKFIVNIHLLIYKLINTMLRRDLLGTAYSSGPYRGGLSSPIARRFVSFLTESMRCHKANLTLAQSERRQGGLTW